VILVGSVFDLHLVALMNREPRIMGFLRRADEHSGVRLGSIRLIDNAQHGIADLLAVVDQQSHSAGCRERAVFDCELSPSDVTPTREVSAVE